MCSMAASSATHGFGLPELRPLMVKAIDRVIGALAHGIRPAEASRDGRSDGEHALLPADIFRVLSSWVHGEESVRIGERSRRVSRLSILRCRITEGRHVRSSIGRVVSGTGHSPRSECHVGRRPTAVIQPTFRVTRNSVTGSLIPFSRL